jgi:L-serine deaminase
LGLWRAHQYCNPFFSFIGANFTMYRRAATKQLRLSGSAALRASWASSSVSQRQLGVAANHMSHISKHTLTPFASKYRSFSSTASKRNNFDDDQGTYSESDHEHAVISTFDLFSIGIGPSSSHTVGPMRAGNIFVADLLAAGLLPKVDRIRVALYGSLALTGEGHMTPSALLLGLESANVETVDTAYVPERFEQIKKDKKLFLGHQLPDGKGKEIAFDFDRDFKWEWGKKLPLHSNGMRLMVFDKEGYMLATNDLFSVGGGFVVNGAMSINKADSDSSSTTDAGLGLSTEAQGAHPSDLAENMYYKEIRREDAAGDRRTGQEIKPVGDAAGLITSGADGGDALPPATSSDDAPSSGGAHGHQPRYPFRDAKSLLALCDKHNLTIAQVVYENEKSHGYTDDEIRDKLFRIWETMDNSILEGVQAPPNSTLPGSLKLQRRAPALYRRLTRGLYPSYSTSASNATEPAQAQLPLDNKESPSGSQTSGTLTTASASSFSPGRKDMAIKRAAALRTHGSFSHPVLPSPRRRTTFPASK